MPKDWLGNFHKEHDMTPMLFQKASTKIFIRKAVSGI